MIENFVDLGNYYEVKEYFKVINMSLSLFMFYLNYMFVICDLLVFKCKVIIEWFFNEKLFIGEK